VVWGKQVANETQRSPSQLKFSVLGFTYSILHITYPFSLSFFYYFCSAKNNNHEKIVDHFIAARFMLAVFMQ
jgi:hypothetical protein